MISILSRNLLSPALIFDQNLKHTFWEIWNLLQVTELKTSFHLSLFSQNVTSEFAGLKIKKKTYFCLLLSHGSGFADFRGLRKEVRQQKCKKCQTTFLWALSRFNSFLQYLWGLDLWLLSSINLLMGFLLVHPNPVHISLFMW